MGKAGLLFGVQGHALGKCLQQTGVSGELTTLLSAVLSSRAKPSVYFFKPTSLKAGPRNGTWALIQMLVFSLEAGDGLNFTLWHLLSGIFFSFLKCLFYYLTVTHTQWSHSPLFLSLSSRSRPFTFHLYTLFSPSKYLSYFHIWDLLNDFSFRVGDSHTSCDWRDCWRHDWKLKLTYQRLGIWKTPIPRRIWTWTSIHSFRSLVFWALTLLELCFSELFASMVLGLFESQRVTRAQHSE